MDKNAVECFESIIGSSTPAENHRLEDRVKEWLRNREILVFDDEAEMSESEAFARALKEMEEVY